nr:GNAT family N-acetyltransferase [Halobellus rarus]
MLDAAMLEFDRERVRRRIDDGDVLVAVTEAHGTPAGGRELGTGETHGEAEPGSGGTHGEAETEGGDCGVDGSETPADRVVGVCVLDAVGRTAADDGDVDATERTPTDDGDFAAVADVVGSERPATEIVSIAVHRSRRGRGIGRALVGAAAARSAGPLVARFHEQVRPFYEALGFEIRAPVSEASGDDGAEGGDGSDSGDSDEIGDRDPISGDDRLYGVLT